MQAGASQENQNVAYSPSEIPVKPAEEPSQATQLQMPHLGQTLHTP